MGNMSKNTRDHVLGIRMTKDELKELDRLRKKRHRTRADMVRILILEEMERQQERAKNDHVT